MTYRFLDHTADVGADLRAPSLDGLFAAALEAFTDTVTERSRVTPRQERRFELAADDAESLLVDWLGEVLCAYEVDGLLFHHAETAVVTTAAGLRLTARARGELYDPARHPIKVLVKGITYHGLAVEERDGGWGARIIFDI